MVCWDSNPGRRMVGADETTELSSNLFIPFGQANICDRGNEAFNIRCRHNVLHIISFETFCFIFLSLPPLSMTRWPQYLLNFWPFTTMKITPITKQFAQVVSNFWPKTKNRQRLLKWCQSGEISPNVVPLHTPTLSLSLCPCCPCCHFIFHIFKKRLS